MQSNQYKQNLALANCTYINIFFYYNILFSTIKPSIIYLLHLVFLYIFKKVHFRFTACASKAKVRTSCQKGKLPYKLLKIVCYNVLKSLEHWLVGRLYDTDMAPGWAVYWMDGAAPWERCPDGLLKSLVMHRMGQRSRIPNSREL